MWDFIQLLYDFLEQLIDLLFGVSFYIGNFQVTYGGMIFVGMVFAFVVYVFWKGAKA